MKGLATVLISIIFLFQAVTASLPELDTHTFGEWINLELQKGSIDGYYDYEGQIALLDKWMTAYPTVIIEKDVIGSSSGDNLPIHAYRLTHNPQNVSPENITGRYTAVLTAMHGGHELLTGDSAIYFLGRVIYGVHKNEPEYLNLVNKYDVWIIPCVNPDALREVKQLFDQNEKIEIIPKNRRNAGIFESCLDISKGVDISRNYDYAWSNPEGASTEACSNHYRGTSAASEPETLAVQEFVKSKSPGIAVNLFGGANQVMIPFSCCPEQEYALPIYSKIYEQIERGSRPPRSKYGKYGTVADTQIQSGNPADWMLMQGVISVNQYIANVDRESEYAPRDHDIRMGALANNLSFTTAMVKRAGVQLSMTRTSDISCHSCTNSRCSAQSLECDLKVDLTNIGLANVVTGSGLDIQLYFTDTHYELYKAWSSSEQLPYQTTNVVVSGGKTHTAYRVKVSALASFEAHRLAFTFNEAHWSQAEKDAIFQNGLPSFVIEVLPEGSDHYLSYTEHLTGLVATFRYNNLPNDYFNDQPRGLEKNDDPKRYFAGFWIFTAVFALLAFIGKCCAMKSAEEGMKGEAKPIKKAKTPHSTRGERFTKPSENVATDAGMLETDR